MSTPARPQPTREDKRMRVMEKIRKVEEAEARLGAVYDKSATQEDRNYACGLVDDAFEEFAGEWRNVKDLLNG